MRMQAFVWPAIELWRARSIVGNRSLDSRFDRVQHTQLAAAISLQRIRYLLVPIQQRRNQCETFCTRSGRLSYCNLFERSPVKVARPVERRGLSSLMRT